MAGTASYRARMPGSHGAKDATSAAAATPIQKRPSFLRAESTKARARAKGTTPKESEARYGGFPCVTANPQNAPETMRVGSPKRSGNGVSRKRSGWNPTAANSFHEKPRERRAAKSDARATSRSQGETRSAPARPPPSRARRGGPRSSAGPRSASALATRSARGARRSEEHTSELQSPM